MRRKRRLGLIWPVSLCACILQSTLEVYDPSQYDIVVLSPDAEEPLLDLDERCVYVVGGIVDRTVRKGVTSSYAVGVRQEPWCVAAGYLASPSQVPILYHGFPSRASALSCARHPFLADPPHSTTEC